MSIEMFDYLALGGLLFCLGIIGFLARRNLITQFLCVEVMLQGVAINFVAFARFHGNLQGQVFVIFILTVAACEAALALALILVLYRRRGSLDASLWQALREPGIEPPEDLDTPDASQLQVDEADLPRLPTAGVAPNRPREIVDV
jgi:NADH-quinone oxidoreductase subunit K